MPEDEVCARGEHLAPRTGGSCPCGMVTRVPVRRPASSGVRDLIARGLVEAGGVPDLADLRRRADRVLRVLADAGLVVGPETVVEAAVAQRSA